MRADAPLGLKKPTIRLEDRPETLREVEAGEPFVDLYGLEHFVPKTVHTAGFERALKHARSWRASVDSPGDVEQPLA
jgi:hypothetical protein